MNNVTGFLSGWSGIPADIWENIIWSVLVLTIAILLRTIILRLLWKGLEKPKLRFLVRRFTSYTLTTVSFIILSGI